MDLKSLYEHYIATYYAIVENDPRPNSVNHLQKVAAAFAHHHVKANAQPVNLTYFSDLISDRAVGS